MQHSGADKENVYGEAASNYMAQVFADVPPGTSVKIIFRHSVSTTWNIPVNGGYGQAAWSFTPYAFTQVGGGVSVNRAVTSGAPMEVSVSTIEAVARWPSPYAGADGGTLVDGGKTYYYIGYFDISGSMWMERPSPAGESGTYSSSIDNIEVRYIGKALKKLPEGDAQTGLVTKPLPKGLNVRGMQDDTGLPVVNEPVTFEVLAPAHNASLSATSAVTDLNGYATTYLTLGTSTGTYTVRATCPGCLPYTNTATFTATAKATELRKVSGDGTMPVGKRALNPLKVQVYNPITNAGEPGYAVDFSLISVPLGGDTANLLTSYGITNGYGIASSPFILGQPEGDYIVKARCESCLGNQEVPFTVTGRDPIEDEHPSGEGQRITFPPPPSGEIGALVIAFQNERMGGSFKAVTRADSRIGVLKKDRITFKGFVAPAPTPPLEGPDYVWSGAASGSGETSEVYFGNTGPCDVTLTVKGKNWIKTRTVKITVAEIDSTSYFTTWLLDNKAYAAQILSCGLAARKWASLYGSGHNDVSDAMRHAYWNACITNIIDAEIASAATSAREFTSVYGEEKAPHNESVMDLENNAIGRNIGGNFPPAFGMAIIQEEIKTTAGNGSLTVLDSLPNQTGEGLLIPSR